MSGSENFFAEFLEDTSVEEHNPIHWVESMPESRHTEGQECCYESGFATRFNQSELYVVLEPITD